MASSGSPIELGRTIRERGTAHAETSFQVEINFNTLKVATQRATCGCDRIDPAAPRIGLPVLQFCPTHLFRAARLQVGHEVEGFARTHATGVLNAGYETLPNNSVSV